MGMAHYQRALQIWQRDPEDAVAKQKAYDLILLAIEQLQKRAEFAKKIVRAESKYTSHAIDASFASKNLAVEAVQEFDAYRPWRATRLTNFGAGADLQLIDNDGYSALDYAVFSGDPKAEAIVLRGHAQAKLADRLLEARLRKEYRQIPQEKLRPILYRAGGDRIKKFRRVYAETLNADAQKSMMFDRFKFIRYTDFASFGRLPRSSDGLTRTLELSPADETNDDPGFIIFFGLTRTGASRDIDREKLGIWMDFACVEQDNPSAGVSALPIMVAQCDAVISLTGDSYYELRRFGMIDKKLSYEEDRPKVMILERQTKFLRRFY
ncbi:hypothetical protein B0H63DRAFT_536265 [Podospora didyma]|uniref:Uncharacterized protein n=1 Tax=Podospora didyma TaxID=330526 RepID=A0AAE0K0Z0_9PEZI|nr:hypothetical protein B0H63DRAFT_536265 [Podospora didyma]